MVRLSGYTGSAATYLMAGAHARASGRCARGVLVTMDDDLIIWLTKDLAS